LFYVIRVKFVVIAIYKSISPYTCGGRRSDPAVGIGTTGSHIPESLRPVLKINYFRTSGDRYEGITKEIS